jgi:hypothetical protein
MHPMALAKARALSEGAFLGLSFIYKYRFLTIAQFARCAGFSAYHAAETLRNLERWGYVGFFGFLSIIGQGKTPKVYYLTKKGFELLCDEGSYIEDTLEPYTEVSATWTPQMYHRLKTIDLLLSAELSLCRRPHMALAKTFLSYRMRRKGSISSRETTDYVGVEETSENKLVPDAAFILENVDTSKCGLFFIEMDMATEQIATNLPRLQRGTLKHKLSQYDKYLRSFRYTQTYANFGEFRSFLLLFVTLTAQRVENIRHAMQDLPSDLAGYYRLTTHEEALGDFFGPIWKSRALSDQTLYPLVQENPT